jgi:SnoaL-like domain
MADADTLQNLADRQAITDLLYRYCRSMDRIDAELGYSIWHEDATADYEGYYTGSGRGFVDAACATHRRMLAHSHQISNIIIELDGDRAGSETYVTGTLRLMKREQLRQLTVWGRYIDQWSRRDGRWGIDRRLQITDFDEIRDVTPASKQERTRRDRSDPSYAVLTRARVP